MLDTLGETVDDTTDHAPAAERPAPSRARRAATLAGSAWIIGSGAYIATRNLPGLVTVLQKCAHCRCCPVRQVEEGLAAEHAAAATGPGSARRGRQPGVAGPGSSAAPNPT